ncbi:MAG: hypothetical protein H6581_00280 [Bacteroidia bacterium]|nr:hypothetical protein [Bacteroidia bacterium]
MRIFPPLLKYFALILIGLTLGLAGCKENGGTDYESDQVTPKRGDWVIIQHATEADALNPFTFKISQAGYIITQLFQPLLSLHPETYEEVPVLAKSMPEMLEDGKKYRFEIREEATWDDGSPITGHDVVFSYKTIKNPWVDAAAYRGYYSFVGDIEVDKDNPKIFTVTTETSFYGSAFAIGDLYVLPKYRYDPDGLMDEFTLPQLNELGSLEELVPNEKLEAFANAYNSEKYAREAGFVGGSGPYSLEKWETGTQVNLVRKEKWWGDKIETDLVLFKAWPEKLIYRVITDFGASVAALKQEEIDVYFSLKAEDFNSLKENEDVVKNFSFATEQSAIFTYIGMNGMPPANRKKFLTDKRVRRAMAHLVDVDMMIKDVYLGYATRLTTPVLPFRPEFNKDLPPIPFDPQKAAALLDEAGWIDANGDGVREKMVDGKVIDMRMDYEIMPNRETSKAVALIFQQEARKIGVELNIVETDLGVLIPRLREHDFDMVALGFSSAPIPTDFKQIWSTESWEMKGSNYFGPTTAEGDSLIEAIRQERDDAKRMKLYQRVQEIIYDEQPVIFMLNPSERFAFHKRFRNVQTTVVKPGFDPQGFWTPTELIRYH